MRGAYHRRAVFPRTRDGRREGDRGIVPGPPIGTLAGAAPPWCWTWVRTTPPSEWDTLPEPTHDPTFGYARKARG
jgi:hypothetical protein